jgi:hypothetical protein
MSDQPFINKSFSEYEDEFQVIRQSIHDDYESRVARWREARDSELEENRKRQREIEETLTNCGININPLKALEDAEEQKLEDFIKKVRSPLIENEPKTEQRTREHLLRSTFYSRSGFTQASLIGADLFVPDMKHLKGIQGVLGNPSVWLQDKVLFKDLSAISTGDGWGCWASGHVPYAHELVWSYVWVPPKTGNYKIVAQIDYHGFYIIRADDRWYNCKKASLNAYTDIEAIQYFPKGKIEHRIIDLEDDNISQSGFVSGSKVWSFTDYFGGGDPVWFVIGFYIDVNARGGGSYSELNFANGNANYIRAPIVFVLG